MVIKYLKNSKGFTAIYAIIFLAIFIPIMFFLVIDLPHFMAINRKVKGALDNATSTAILQIDESKTSEGLLIINESEAEEMALKVIRETFDLNEDMSIKKDNLISNTPTIEVVVINNISNTPSYTTENGTFYFNNPSVLIYAEFPVRGKFLNFSEKTIKYTSIAQVQFRR